MDEPEPDNANTSVSIELNGILLSAFENRMQAPSPFSGKFTDGRYYRCKVIKKYDDYVSVEYEDGDIEDVTIDRLRPITTIDEARDNTSPHTSIFIHLGVSCVYSHSVFESLCRMTVKRGMRTRCYKTLHQCSHPVPARIYQVTLQRRTMTQRSVSSQRPTMRLRFKVPRKCYRPMPGPRRRRRRRRNGRTGYRTMNGCELGPSQDDESTTNSHPAKLSCTSWPTFANTIWLASSFVSPKIDKIPWATTLYGSCRYDYQRPLPEVRLNLNEPKSSPRTFAQMCLN